MKGYTCYLGLGGNLGSPQENIKNAISKLALTDKIQIKAVSSMYRTPPWGKLDQPEFINGVAEIYTELSPQELLQVCRQVETDLGRKRLEHWGARTIDIDILYIPEVSIDEENLKVPHPYMLERAFVLVPLAEIGPHLTFGGRGILEICQGLEDVDRIIKL